MNKQEYNQPEYPTEAHGAIPAFNNIEEEAEFWDTHDTPSLRKSSNPSKSALPKIYQKGSRYASIRRQPMKSECRPTKKV